MRAYGTQIHVPAAAAHVVSVADFISKLRAFAAEIANLCHFNDSQIFLTQKGFEASGRVVKGKFYRKIAGLATIYPTAAVFWDGLMDREVMFSRSRRKGRSIAR